MTDLETSTQPSLLSESLTGKSEIPIMTEPKPEEKKQYDNVKRRYYSSLGMNRPTPAMSSSVPIHQMRTMGFSENNLTVEKEEKIFTFETENGTKRDRTKTTPMPKNEPLMENLRKQRTSSTPIPINGPTSKPMVAASVGTYLMQSKQDSDDEDNVDYLNKSTEKTIGDLDEELLFNSENDELSLSSSSSSARSVTSPTASSSSTFVPPHEMLAKNMKEEFNVGTAHSLAVWEQRRRPKNMV